MRLNLKISRITNQALEKKLIDTGKKRGKSEIINSILCSHFKKLGFTLPCPDEYRELHYIEKYARDTNQPRDNLSIYIDDDVFEVVNKYIAMVSKNHQCTRVGLIENIINKYLDDSP